MCSPLPLIILTWIKGALLRYFVKIFSWPALWPSHLVTGSSPCPSGSFPRPSTFTWTFTPMWDLLPFWMCKQNFTNWAWKLLTINLLMHGREKKNPLKLNVRIRKSIFIVNSILSHCRVLGRWLISLPSVQREVCRNLLYKILKSQIGWLLKHLGGCIRRTRNFKILMLLECCHFNVTVSIWSGFPEPLPSCLATVCHVTQCKIGFLINSGESAALSSLENLSV